MSVLGLSSLLEEFAMRNEFMMPWLGRMVSLAMKNVPRCIKSGESTHQSTLMEQGFFLMINRYPVEGE